MIVVKNTLVVGVVVVVVVEHTQVVEVVVEYKLVVEEVEPGILVVEEVEPGILVVEQKLVEEQEQVLDMDEDMVEEQGLEYGT
jgi:hypothetical protein